MKQEPTITLAEHAYKCILMALEDVETASSIMDSGEEAIQNYIGDERTNNGQDSVVLCEIIAATALGIAKEYSLDMDDAITARLTKAVLSGYNLGCGRGSNKTNLLDEVLIE